MSTENTIYGTPVVNGLAYGPVAWVSRFEIPKLDSTIISLDKREERFSATPKPQRLSPRDYANAPRKP